MKMLRVQFSPIADSPEGNISDDPAWEPAMAPEKEFDEDENPWERGVWED